MCPTDDKKDLQSFICPGCKRPFDFQICSSVFSGRVPLVLHCGHTVCEECVKQNLQRREVSCCECKVKWSIGEGEKRTLQESFMVNFYLLGKIMYLNPKSNSMPGLHSSLQNKMFRKKPLLTTTLSSESSVTYNTIPTTAALVNKLSACSKDKCTNIANLYCKNCEEKYCEACSIAIHKMARAFKSHKILPISNPSDNSDLEVNTQCHLHPVGIIDFHCNTCDEDVCCYCILQSHVSHEYQQLTNLNEKEMSDFENLITTAEQKLKSYKTSLRKIEKELKTKSCGKHIRTDFLLSTFFTNLHARIQFLEKNLKESIVDDIKNQETTLSILYSEVQSNINSLSKLITMAKDMFSSKNAGKINVKNIRNKIEEFVTAPSHLFGEKINKDSERVLDDKDVIEQIKEIAKNLCDSNAIEYKLLNTDELPLDYVDELVVDDDVHEDELSCETSSVNSVTENGGLFRFYQRQSSKTSSESLPLDFGLKTNDYENVTVTHINSPESFYVNVDRYKLYLQKLQEKIKSYVKVASKVRNAEIRKMYLAFYDDVSTTTCKWYRAELIDITTTDQIDFFFTVYFIDYGNTKKVKLSYLKEISQELMQIPPLGFHCKLYGILFDYEKCMKETQKFMAQMIKNNDTAIRVVDIQNGVCEVHLFVFDSYGDCTSVASALEFIGHASTVEEINDVKIPKVVNAYPVTLYERVDNYQVKQTLFVRFSHVDEESVFVQDAAKEHDIERLTLAMNEFYRSKNKLRIFCIKVGMECAVEIDKTWYRCLVLKVYTGSGTADVKLVDTGKRCKVSYMQMRRLTTEFTKMECQAIQVVLADVVPIYEKSTWSKEAVELLSHYVDDLQKLRMVIVEASSLPKVVLFEVQDTYDISINGLLVEKKLADSTGDLSLKSKWPRNNVDGGDAKKNVKDNSYTLKLMKTIQSNNIDVANDNDNAASTSKQTKTILIKSSPTKPVPITDKDKLIPVTVLKMESPDEIYINIIAESLHSEYDELRKTLIAHYSEMSPSDVDWSFNDTCVMQLKPKNEFYRVKIVEKCPSGNYRVKLVDFATETEVPKDQLYDLDHKFKKYPFYAVKCHLDGVEPSGDKKKWSLMACDFVRETIQAQTDLFIKKSPYDKSEKSIPITIFYKEIISGGALSPDETVMHSLNGLLIENGLAFKKKDDWNEMIEEANRSIDNLSDDDGNESPDFTVLSDDKNDIVCASPQNNDKGNVVRSYIPAPSLAKNYTFTGIVTYISDSGLLYIQNSTVNVVYEELEKKMKEFFDNVPFDENVVYKPKDLCTVRYENGNWYRGQIIKRLDPDTYLVHMTDFGNDEEVEREDLRHVIMHADIPVLVQKIKMIRVFSNTRHWNTSDTILLQEKVDGVPLWVKVIVEEMDNKPALAEVRILDTKENVNEYMVKYSTNLSNFNPKTLINIKDEEEDVIIMSEED